ncbi:MAG TPA: hypothetical protein VK824_12105, partial [Planctomycetota bacterium]|nr:hypothetical protein [Planctomycetota bacterium]
QAAIPALGGTFLLGDILGTQGIITSAGGTSAVAGTLPNSPVVSGLQVTLQHWLIDPAAPKGKAGTNGVKFTIE